MAGDATGSVSRMLAAGCRTSPTSRASSTASSRPAACACTSPRPARAGRCCWSTAGRSTGTSGAARRGARERAAADHARPARLRLVGRARRADRAGGVRARPGRAARRARARRGRRRRARLGRLLEPAAVGPPPNRVRRLLAVSSPSPWLKVTPQIGLETWRAWYAVLFAAGLMERDNGGLGAWFMRREGIPEHDVEVFVTRVREPARAAATTRLYRRTCAPWPPPPAARPPPSPGRPFRRCC